MHEFTYHLNVLTNDYDFGLKDDQRLLVLEANQNLTSNPDLLNLINTLKSFRVYVDTGTGTARLERGYWYIYKKIIGVLHKEYLAKSEDITEALLTEVVRKVNVQKKTIKHNVSINDDVLIRQPPIAPDVTYELAGNGKSEKHLQPNLIPVNQEIAMLRAEVEHLKGYINQRTNSHIVLGEELRAVQRDRLKIINERDAIAKDLLIYSTGHRNFKLGVVVAQERIGELENTIEDSNEMLKILRDEAKNAIERIFQLECESSKRGDDIQGYYFMHEELSEQVFKYRTLIEKYRLLAKGKDKRNHPRYAYMIDFLTEIDNLF